MNKTKRFLIGLVFVLSIMVIGLVLGMLIAGRCCVPADSGLAGGAIVVGYGVLSAGVGGLIALALAIYLPERWLVGSTVGLALVGTVLGGILGKVYLDARAETAAHLERAYEDMLKYRVTLVHTDAAPARPFQRIRFDWGERSYTVLGSGGEHNPACTMRLSGAQGAKMLGALRAVEGVVYRHPAPCAGTPGAVQHELDMFIPEAKPPNSAAKLAITAACLDRYPALAEPFAVARQIHAVNDLPENCD